MRWEDENYVRLYTRDTAEWLCLSFLAQGLFALLLRKVDRAGILHLGKLGAKAVAVVIGHPGDWSRLEPALDELLSDGCVRIEGERLIVPNFIEAQSAVMSDKQRKAEQRARDRDLAAAGIKKPDKVSRNGTPCHETGQKVTSSHDASRAVTLNYAVPSLTKRSPTPRAGMNPAEEKWPNIATLLVALLDRGYEAFWPRDEDTARNLERAIETAGITEAANRVMAEVEAARKRRVEPPAYLGWHLDAIRGADTKPQLTHGDLGAEIHPWPTRLTDEQQRQARSELAALHPDLEGAPLGMEGIPGRHPVGAIAEFNRKWRAIAESRP